MAKLLEKIDSKWVIPVCTTAMAIIFIGTGIVKYGFWHETKGPTPGFVPIIVAALLLITSIMAFYLSFKEKPVVFPKENNLVILSGLGIFLGTFIIGLIPTVVLYVVFWLRFLEKTPWKQTLIVLSVVMAIVVGVFVLWLGVPFPNGMIIDEFFS